jgi:hypothetical protein
MFFVTHLSQYLSIRVASITLNNTFCVATVPQVMQYFRLSIVTLRGTVFVSIVDTDISVLSIISYSSSHDRIALCVILYTSSSIYVLILDASM